MRCILSLPRPWIRAQRKSRLPTCLGPRNSIWKPRSLRPSFLNVVEVRVSPAMCTETYERLSQTCQASEKHTNACVSPVTVAHRGSLIRVKPWSMPPNSDRTLIFCRFSRILLQQSCIVFIQTLTSNKHIQVVAAFKVPP